MKPRAAESRLLVRRRARSLAYANGALWAAGSALVGSQLIIYLAADLRVAWQGFAVAMILAARHVLGLLRWAAPALIGHRVRRKPFCLVVFGLSVAALVPLPLTAAPGALPTATAALWALVGLWCLYHVLEYTAGVALWSWFADIAPRRYRGRFFGRRERWMLVGTIGGTLAGLGLAAAWRGLAQHWPDYSVNAMSWLRHTLLAECGAALIGLALLPLARMPAFEETKPRVAQPVGRELAAPLADASFRRFLFFGCGLSLASGLTQSDQHLFAINQLGISYALTLTLTFGMRVGQMLASPWLGRLADRRGNRLVLAGSVLISAAGLLFFIAAGRFGWPWYLGASVCWIAYAGVNVAEPNYLAALGPHALRTSYFAAFFALTGLAYAAGTLLGGLAHDCFAGHVLPGGISRAEYFALIFFAGWALRGLAVVPLLRLGEPRCSERQSEL